MVADEIMLPCTDDGEPDCDYMSSYMKKILEESKTYIEKLNQVKSISKNFCCASSSE